jgi:hypothetical protein
VAKLNRLHPDPASDDRSAPLGDAASGHPSVEQLMAEQGTGPIKDVSVLHGDFWPEEEPTEAFLEALHEWRGHNRIEPVQ